MKLISTSVYSSNNLCKCFRKILFPSSSSRYSWHSFNQTSIIPRTEIQIFEENKVWRTIFDLIKLLLTFPSPRLSFCPLRNSVAFHCTTFCIIAFFAYLFRTATKSMNVYIFERKSKKKNTKFGWKLFQNFLYILKIVRRSASQIDNCGNRQNIFMELSSNSKKKLPMQCA